MVDLVGCGVVPCGVVPCGVACCIGDFASNTSIRLFIVFIITVIYAICAFICAFIWVFICSICIESAIIIVLSG